MSTVKDKWTIRVAASLAIASRWLSAMSLMATAIALLLLYSSQTSDVGAASLSTIVVLGIVQLYFTVRIEFDRAVFAASEQTSCLTNDDLEVLDKVLNQSRLRTGVRATRTLEERLRGVASLVRWAAIVTIVQVSLLISASWVAR